MKIREGSPDGTGKTTEERICETLVSFKFGVKADVGLVIGLHDVSEDDDVIVHYDIYRYCKSVCVVCCR